MNSILMRAKAEEVKNILVLILKALNLLDWTNNIFMSTLITKLTKHDDGLNNSLADEAKDALTKQLSDKDDTRDAWWVGIGHYLRGAMCFPGRISVSASIIYEIWQSRGESVQNQSYEMETTSINVIMDKLFAPDMEGHVQTVKSLPDYLTELRRENNDFSDLYAKRGSLEAEEEDALPLSIQKKETLLLINKQLIPFLDLMAATDTETFGTLAKTIESYVDELNTKVRTRKTRSVKDLAEAIPSDEASQVNE